MLAVKIALFFVLGLVLAMMDAGTGKMVAALIVSLAIYICDVAEKPDVPEKSTTKTNNMTNNIRR